jgi:alpha-tubulin suppressor-like RCC1 family protein
VALDTHGNVFSWGQGEGGLLGHNDTQIQNTPKLIEGLRNVLVDSICCGGLHTLALSKNGLVYAWGRGEGGQLGLAFNLLTNEDGNLYLTTPKRVRANLEGILIKQIACGDAHSLALAQNGKVFGWGYTNSGQLGLGITGDTLEGNPKYNSIQIREPVLIESLTALNVTKVSLILYRNKEF